MAISELNADQGWGMLAGAEEQERRAKILQRCIEMVALPAEERVSQMLAMAKAEYELPDDKLRAFTLSRLSTRLDMDTESIRQYTV